MCCLHSYYLRINRNYSSVIKKYTILQWFIHTPGQNWPALCWWGLTHFWETWAIWAAMKYSIALFNVNGASKQPLGTRNLLSQPAVDSMCTYLGFGKEILIRYMCTHDPRQQLHEWSADDDKWKTKNVYSALILRLKCNHSKCYQL